MTDAQMWSLIVGFLVPPFLAVIQQPGWSDGLRAVVSFVVAILVALGTVYFAGNLDFGHEKAWISAILLVFVTAIATYRDFWKQTGIAPTIEAITSGRGSQTNDARRA